MEEKFMKQIALVLLAIILAFGLVAFSGCSKKKKDKYFFPPTPDAFSLSVDSLEITGEVDDAEVTEVDVDGAKWPVTAGEFSGTVNTTAKSKVEITAEDNSGNTGKKTIEIK
jgi:hypothetical protein